jgi:hypothetical protein
MKVEWKLTGLLLNEVVGIVIKYIGFEVGIRKMNPNSIKACYLGALSNVFVLKNIENVFEFACKKKLVKLVLDGYLRIHHQANPISGQRKLAFTLELVKYLKDATSHRSNINEIMLNALEVALKMGIYFLLRKSEYLPGTNSAGLKWKDIKCYNAAGFEVDLNNISYDKVETITLNIPYSKTDKYGIGRVVTHTKTNQKCCIVRSITEWICLCRDRLKSTSSGYVFKFSNGDNIINDQLVAQTMKDIVSFLGWKSDKVSAHSLRYGGATMLAAAGLPQYIIEYYGGWAENSKALKQTYIKLAAKGANNVSVIFSNGFNMSLEETRIREAKLI